MKKNLLFSLVALTATPMGVNANVVVDLPADKTDWTTDAENDLTIEAGVIVSPKGSAVSYTKELLPGKYQVTCKSAESVNVKLSVDGKAVDLEKGAVIELKQTQQVEFKLEAVDITAEGGFKLSGLQLELVFDFKAAGDVLQGKLGGAQVGRITLEKTGKYYETLISTSSALANDIVSVQNAEANPATAYDIYKKFELYKGVENCTLVAQLVDFKKKIDNAVERVEWYNKAKAAIDVATAGINNLNWDTRSDYTKTQFKAEYEALQTYVNNFAQGVEDYQSEAFVNKFTPVAVETFAKEFSTKCSDLSKKLNGTDANDSAFQDVSARLTEVKEQQNKIVQDLSAKLQPYEVYANMLSAATNEMSTTYMDMLNHVNAPENNGTESNHAHAAETKAANLKLINDVVVKLNQIQTEYTAKYNDNEARYKKETAQIGEWNKLVILDQTAQEQLNKEAIAAQTEAKKLIDEFEAKVNTDRKAYTIAVANYEKDYAAIQVKVDLFVEKSGADVANYLAYTALHESLTKSHETFDKAKQAVNALVSTDKKYSAKDKYAEAEKTFTDELAKYDNEIAEVQKTGAVEYKKANAEALDALCGKYIQYQKDAEEVMAHYNELSKSLVAQSDAVKNLRKAVSDPDVLVKLTGETYGAAITRLQSSIDDVQRALDAALILTGNKHRDAMLAVQAASNIQTEVETLIKSYEQDKKDFENQNLLDAALSLQTRGSELIEIAKAKVNTTLTQAELGKRYQEVTDSLATINLKISEQEAENKKPITEANALERISFLNKVQTKLNAINAELDEYLKVIDGIKANVKDNKQKYDELLGEPKGKLSSLQKVLSELTCEDADHEVTEGKVKISFTGKKTALTETLQALVAEIKKSYDDETLVNDCAEKYDTRIVEAQTALKDIKDLKVQVEANLAAKNALNEAYKKADFTKLLSDAKLAIDAITDTDGPKMHFQEMYTNYETEANAITKDIDKAYADTKSVAQQKSIENRINKLITNLSVIAETIQTNAEKHDELVKLATATETAWTDAYNFINEHDKTSKRQEHLDQLLSIHNDMLGTGVAVANDYKNAESAQNFDARQSAYNAAQAEITNVRASQNEDTYNPVVQEDNKKYLEEFNRLIGEAKESYKIAANTIRSYNTEIQHEELKTALEQIIAANQGIFDYGTDLDLFNQQIQKDWNTFIQSNPGKIYDAEKNNLKEAKAKKATIDQALQKLQSEAAVAAQQVVRTSWNQANNRLDQAKTYLETYKFGEDIQKTAFSREEELLNQLNPNDAPTKDPNYALTCDKRLDDLQDNFNEWLDQDKVKAGEDEWARLYNVYTKQIKDEYEQLSTFSYVPSFGTTEGTKEAYETMVYKTFVHACDITKDPFYMVPVYGRLPEIKTFLDQFDQSKIFEEAKAAALDKTVNDEILAKLSAVLQTNGYDELDTLKTYALKYIVGSQPEWRRQYSIAENEIKKTYADRLQREYDAGTLDENEKELTQLMPKAKKDIEKFYAIVDALEQECLEEQLGLLRGEYNSAVAHGLTGEERQRYESRINKLADNLELTRKEVKLKANHVAFQEYEAEISIMFTELRQMFDAPSIVEATAAVNSRYSEVEASFTTLSNYLAETTVTNGHDKVQKYHTPDLNDIQNYLAQVKSEMEQKMKDQTTIFYKDNILEHLQVVNQLIDNADYNACNTQSKYDTHHKLFRKLENVIQQNRTDLERVWDLITEWNLQDNDNYLYQKERIQEEISITESIRDYFAKVQDDNEAIDTDLMSPSNEYEWRYNDVKYWIINDLEVPAAKEKIEIENQNSMSKVNKLWSFIFTENEYTTDDKEQLKDEFENHNSNRQHVWNFYYFGIHWGESDYDIYGNPLPWPEQFSFYEEYPNILARYAEIQSAVDATTVLADELRVIVGDVNGDRQISTSDFRLVVDEVLTNASEPGSREFMSADVDRSGEINVADVTAILNKIKGINPVQAAMYVHPLTAAPVLNDQLLITVEGEGTSRRIAINLNNSNAFVAGQMDIVLPEGITLVGETCGSRANNHQLYSADLADGVHRILFTSLDNTEITGSEGAVIYLDVEVSHNYKGDELIVNKVMFTDAAARLYTVKVANQNVTGIDTVTLGDEIKSKVYNVGGQLLRKVQQGVNVILMKDGSVKKVLKK